MPTHMHALCGHGVSGQVAEHPVSFASYHAYLEEAGIPVPAAVARAPAATSPVTNVSQDEAREYCQWLGEREGRAYRLPTMAELQELAADALAEGISQEIWPHELGHRPEVRGGLKEVYLCEWTCEVEELPQPEGRPRRVLGSVFYPPWLRHGSNATHAQAHMLATEGYSFVTFRLAGGI